MKRKLASLLIALAFGWFGTAAFAEDEAAASTDPAASSEPAAASEDSTDTATIDASASDGTISATPAETETESK